MTHEELHLILTLLFKGVGGFAETDEGVWEHERVKYTAFWADPEIAPEKLLEEAGDYIFSLGIYLGEQAGRVILKNEILNL